MRTPLTMARTMPTILRPALDEEEVIVVVVVVEEVAVVVRVEDIGTRARRLIR